MLTRLHRWWGARCWLATEAAAAAAEGLPSIDWTAVAHEPGPLAVAACIVVCIRFVERRTYMGVCVWTHVLETAIVLFLLVVPLPVCLPAVLPDCLSACLSVCLPVCLIACLPTMQLRL